MRLLITSILALTFSQLAFAQDEDLSGTWEGSGGGCEYATISIIRYNNTYIGFTYDEGMGYCKCHFVGEYDPKTKKLKGENKGVIKKTITHVQSRYNLKYENFGGREFLRGTISAKSALLSIPSPIRYTRTSHKVDTTDFMRTWLRENATPLPPEIVKHDAPVSPPVAMADTAKAIEKPAPVITEPVKPVAPTVAEAIIKEKNKRTTDTLSVINTDAKELLIKVMDNGIIDGDTVSIIHNGRIIAERISVKAIPYEIKIPMDKQHNRQEIVLVAHNLGSISPNTALIIIETPEKQYRLTASTDLSKNAMIIFQYKE
jgi:hypothetical protein